MDSSSSSSSELQNVTHLFEPIKLKKLPHLTHYTTNLQPLPNPLDHNPYFNTLHLQNFYITPNDVVLSHATRFAYRTAGPRNNVYFNPSDVRVAIVTCGGLCPGLNTVIRELVVGLWNLYGVRHIFGVTGGYRGFYSTQPVMLDPNVVHNWHNKGGTLLQTSRGGFDLCKIVDAIQNRAFNQVYIIGGDGTMRGAVKIFNEIRQRKLNIAVVGIPKTLMGRSTGHIALHATLSSRDVDCCLIPELDFYLEGKGGLFEFLDQRLKENGHAVLVVAEGAGQDIIPRTDSQKEERDESGNLVFLDIGVWLKSELNKWWDREHPGELFTVKYIDPTYMIRAVHANATDNLYCTLLAHSAIHAVMAGYTGFVAGPINGNYAYIPLEDVACAKNPVNTKDHNWSWVRSVTNQPDFLKSY
ncbi:hypothetical protein RYX36_037337 [Vicia faba]